ncbi:hypothetical protein QYM36_004285 [Artemia franciscana]|uniref:Uncharacterized protein n=1 Tax=Artemia franciscana TaxID=6661 RepID=A0AA88IG94_ARTSF|nr:hypothetical protein QYM36_004285 [Artemia franciscana]
MFRMASGLLNMTMPYHSSAAYWTSLRWNSLLSQRLFPYDRGNELVTYPCNQGLSVKQSIFLEDQLFVTIGIMHHANQLCQAERLYALKDVCNIDLE